VRSRNPIEMGRESISGHTKTLSNVDLNERMRSLLKWAHIVFQNICCCWHLRLASWWLWHTLYSHWLSTRPRPASHV